MIIIILILSIEACLALRIVPANKNETAVCPPDMVLRKVKIGQFGSATISMSCYLPGTKNSTIVYAGHHIRPQYHDNSSCSLGIKGFKFSFDGGKYMLKALCFYYDEDAYDMGSICSDDDSFVCGIKTTNYKRTTIITSASVICCTVSRPQFSCNVTGEFRKIRSFDAGYVNRECSLDITIAFRKNQGASETTSRELNLYSSLDELTIRSNGHQTSNTVNADSNVGFLKGPIQVGASLSNSFTSGTTREFGKHVSKNLGTSTASGNNYNSIYSRDYSVSVTESYKIPVPAGVKTDIEQFFVECGGYWFSTPEIRCKDYNSTGYLLTTRVINQSDNETISTTTSTTPPPIMTTTPLPASTPPPTTTTAPEIEMPLLVVISTRDSKTHENLKAEVHYKNGNLESIAKQLQDIIDAGFINNNYKSLIMLSVAFLINHYETGNHSLPLNTLPGLPLFPQYPNDSKTFKISLE